MFVKSTESHRVPSKIVSEKECQLEPENLGKAAELEEAFGPSAL